MADVVRFTNGKAEYIKSVNTPDYEGPDTIVNPDLSSLVGVDVKYWKRSGNTVVEMDAAEKQAVDESDLQARKDKADNVEITLDLLLRGLVHAGNQRWSKGQEITRAEVVTWLKGQIN